MLGGKVIPVKLNGIAMSVIYDTGCSGVQISLHELQTLLKNGRFDQNDFIGFTTASIADGSEVENGVVNIKQLEIGNGDNSLVLHDVKASVALNQKAPILLGNTVLDELATIEVDNIEKTINFHKK